MQALLISVAAASLVAAGPALAHDIEIPGQVIYSFDHDDRNDDGVIDRDEYMAAHEPFLAGLSEHLPASDVEAIGARILSGLERDDQNGDGVLDYEEVYASFRLRAVRDFSAFGPAPGGALTLDHFLDAQGGAASQVTVMVHHALLMEQSAGRRGERQQADAAFATAYLTGQSIGLDLQERTFTRGHPELDRRITEAFEAIDRDGDGVITVEEFTRDALGYRGTS